VFKRLGILLVVLSLSLVVASPAFAQESRADRIIDRTFDRVFGSPSQSQYDQPTPPNANGNVPPQAQRALCRSIVRNNAVPRSIQRQIARQFGLDCKPAGSFLDSFFRGFPF
jgi:hypothetical protein